MNDGDGITIDNGGTIFIVGNDLYKVLDINDVNENKINPTTGEIYRELEQGTDQSEEININQLQTWIGGTSENEPTETSTNLPIYVQPKGGSDYIHFDSGSTIHGNGLQTYGREKRSILLSNDLDLTSETGTYIPDTLKMGSTADGLYGSGMSSAYTFENGIIFDLKFSLQGKNSFHDVIVDVMEEGDSDRLHTLDIYLADSSNGDAYC